MNVTTEQSSSSESTADQIGSALILVVERNTYARRLKQYFLENAGFRVEFAEDGRQAYEQIKTLRPSIFITEILVPKIDGLSLIRMIRDDSNLKKLPVLVFSILEAEDRALEAGADAFLIKPLNDTVLIETVQRLLATAEHKDLTP